MEAQRPGRQAQPAGTPRTLRLVPDIGRRKAWRYASRHIGTGEPARREAQFALRLCRGAGGRLEVRAWLDGFDVAIGGPGETLSAGLRSALPQAEESAANIEEATRRLQSSAANLPASIDAAIGIDGCRSGWLSVKVRRDGSQEFSISKTLAEIEGLPRGRVMIDMPIGLPDRGNRSCDIEARRILAPRAQVVFTGARRPLLNHVDSYAAANALGYQLGAGVSRQLFSLLPKIRDVDGFVRSTGNTQVWFSESHPELIFHRLANGAPLAPKKSMDGHKQRYHLLLNEGFTEIDRWRSQLRGSGAKLDDLLDACACAIAALDAANGIERKVPSDAQIDAEGLRMEIWY